MGYVFISYSHKDKEYVQRLKKALEDEQFEVWIDSHIKFGDRWSRAIQNNLDGCSAFLVVLSENSSSSDWVENEVARAQRKGKPIFPLLLSGEPPLAVEGIQYHDVRDKTLPQKKFYQDLKQKLSQNQSENAALSVAQARIKPSNPLLMIGSLGLFSLILIILLWSLWSLYNGSSDGRQTPIVPTQLSIPSETQAFMIQPSSTESATPTFTSTYPPDTATFSPTPTVSLPTTSIPAETTTPADTACIPDIAFVTNVPLGDRMMLSFDAPFSISYFEMDNQRNINLGPNLSLLVSSTEYTNFTAGLYNTDKPYRLFIMSYLRPGLKIQVLLNQEGAWHCTDVLVIPPFPPAPTHKPAPERTPVPVKG